jgi:hypothetical protein
MANEPRWVGAAGAVALCLVLAGPARADFCVQLDGPALSGDLGFFRFKGKLPKKAGKIKPLHGRVAGLSPANGTATVYKDKSGVELGVEFYADAAQGQFDVSIFANQGWTAGSGYANYGAYDVTFGHTVTVVSCNLEP